MTPLTCAFGTVWRIPHVCAACDAYSRELRRQFVQAVLDGRFDREGYTKAERRKAERRKAERRKAER